MKRVSVLLTLSLFVALLVASCKKGDKTGLLVPEDAGLVVHINSPSLTSKLSWEEISQTEWFQELSKEATDSTAQKLLKDPGQSGIDTKADLVFYIKKQGRGGYVALTGTVKDAAAFEAFNKEISKGEATVTKDGDISYMSSNKPGILAWNSSRFVYIGDSPLPDMQQAFDRQASHESYKFPTDSLKMFGKTALTLKSDVNLDKDSRFSSLIQDGSDVHIWANVSGLYGNSLGSGMLSMMKLNMLLDGNVSATSLNFDNGKIAVKSKQYYGEEMRKLLSDYPAKPLSEDVINRIPSQNVVGVFAMNYPPAGLKEFLKATGIDGMTNGFLGQVGYSIDEFIKANKGDLLIAVSDLEMKTKEKVMDMGEGQEPHKYSSTEPDMKVLFAASINDKPAFDKLVGIALEQTKGMMSSNSPEIHYKLDNNWFAASNSQEHVDKFLAGGSAKNAVADKISGHPFGFFIDIQKIIKSTESTVTDSNDKAAMTASVNMWQDVIATGGTYKDKSIEFQFEINLVDKNTNSLKQLNQYINTIYKIHEDKKKKNMGYDNTTDSLTAPPGVDQKPVN
ncbi:MAG: DUF4836 family protein [Chitinophagaceae bacterium]